MTASNARTMGARAVFWIFLDTVAAWPSMFSCDYSCFAALSPGGSFRQMGIQNYGPAPTGANCEITTNVGAGGYSPGTSYVVAVSMSSDLAVKLVSDVAGFDGSPAAEESSNVRMFSKPWTATAASSATFRALCGAGGSVDEMWVASPITVSKDPTATAAPTITGPTTVTTTGAPAGAITGDATLELMPGLTLGSSISGDTATISVVSDRNSWVGVGFSRGSTVSMTGGGNGVDLFACTSGAVKRYWVTQKTVPSGGVSVASSSCSYVNGKTTMTFRRPLAKEGVNTVQITPGTGQVLIYARGAEGAASGFTMHVTADRNGKSIDFATLAATEAKSKSAELALWAHLFCMILCFSFLLPWGVALANRTRGASAGTWIKLHRGFQVTGWCVQLLGFAMAIWHCAANAGGHFGSSPNEDAHWHTYTGIVVIVLTTQQPLNAFVRPHPQIDGLPKTTGRSIFEIVHKGTGYTAVVVGILNVWSGINLLGTLSYDTTVRVVAMILAILGTLPVVVYWVLSCFKQDNFVARLCVGLAGGQFGDGKKDDGEHAVIGKGKVDPAPDATADMVNC